MSRSPLPPSYLVESSADSSESHLPLPAFGPAGRQNKHLENVESRERQVGPYRPVGSRTWHAGKTMHVAGDAWRDFICRRDTSIVVNLSHPTRYLGDGVTRIGYSDVDSRVVDGETLSRRERWDTILEYLIENCQSVSVLNESHGRSDGWLPRVTLNFRFPVVREIDAQWHTGKYRSDVVPDVFTWRGQQFHRGYLYQMFQRLPNVYFKLVGLESRIKLPDDLTYIPYKPKFVKKEFGHTGECRIGDINAHSYWDYFGDVKRGSPVVLDLGQNQSISHLVTGGQRYETVPFPTRDERKYIEFPGCHLIRVFKQYTGPSESYAKRIRIEVRQHSSREWIDLGIFHANTNCLDEVMIKLTQPVLAQYLRVSIIESGKDRPYLRVGVVGPKSSEQIALEKSKTDLVTCAVTFIKPDDAIAHPHGYDHYDPDWFHPIASWPTTKRAARRSHMRALQKARNGPLHNDIGSDEVDDHPVYDGYLTSRPCKKNNQRAGYIYMPDGLRYWQQADRVIYIPTDYDDYVPPLTLDACLRF